MAEITIIRCSGVSFADRSVTQFRFSLFSYFSLLFFLFVLNCMRTHFNLHSLLPSSEAQAKNSRSVDSVVVCFWDEGAEDIFTYCWQDRYQAVGGFFFVHRRRDGKRFAQPCLLGCLKVFFCVLSHLCQRVYG